MPRGIKGFVRGHETFNIGKCPKGRTPWNKGMRGVQKAWNKGKKWSDQTRENMSKAKIGKYIGEKSWNWKGGLSPIVKLIRQSQKGVEWTQGVLLRDDFTCQECGERGGSLIAHHIKHFIILLREAIGFLPLFSVYDAAMMYSPLWDLINGKTVCLKCHKIIHKKIGSGKKKDSFNFNQSGNSR